MDAVAESEGSASKSKHHIAPCIHLSVENDRASAGQDGRTVSRDQIIMRERGHGKTCFPLLS